MKNFAYQTNLNFKRIILRNKRFFFFDLILPIIFYLLYTKMLTKGIPSAALDVWNKEYMVSMIIFSCLLGSIITVSNTLLEDHTSHFDLFVAISPLSKVKYYASLIIVFLTLNLISIISIIMIGIFVNHVELSFIKLLSTIIISVIGSIVLILIGIIISTFKNPSTVNMLNSLAVFPVAMLSGLWWPMSMMPNWLQVFGKLLPTYAISNVINNVIFNKALQLSNIVNLISWFVGLLLVIIVLTKLVPRQELQSE